MAGMKIVSLIDHAARHLEQQNVAERARTALALNQRADDLLDRIRVLRERIDAMNARLNTVLQTQSRSEPWQQK